MCFLFGVTRIAVGDCTLIDIKNKEIQTIPSNMSHSDLLVPCAGQ